MSLSWGPGSGGAGTHTYWRLNFTTTESGGQSCGAVELTSMVAGNLTYGGTPISIGPYSPSYSAAQSFEYGYGYTIPNRFYGGTTSGGWMGYEFSEPVEINQVFYEPGNGSIATTPPNFDVQYSDDESTWTTSWSVTGQSAFTVDQPRMYINPDWLPSTYFGSPWGAHQYWRILNFNTNFTCAEVQFYDKVGGTNQATGGTASSLTNASGLVPANAFDGVGTTYFSLASGDVNGGWLEYEFASPVTVGAVGITARADAAYAQAPTYFFTQFSDDGTHWTSAWLSEATWTAESEHQVFEDPNYNGESPTKRRCVVVIN